MTVGLDDELLAADAEALGRAGAKSPN